MKTALMRVSRNETGGMRVVIYQRVSVSRYFKSRARTSARVLWSPKASMALDARDVWSVEKEVTS